MKDGILKEKSKRFAIRVVNLCRILKEDKKEFEISKQLIRSGTSIGANIREAEHAQSRSDFLHKRSIALKEANETEYWLEILHETNYLTDEQFKSIFSNCNELCKMLIAGIKTLKSNIS